MADAIDAVLDSILNEILEKEGGLTNDKEDRGGITNYGVSLRYARGKPQMDLDHDGDIDENDIVMVTPEVAKQLFREDFFDRPGFAELPEPLWAQMFDIAVNAGALRAGILLQRTLVRLGFSLNIDGRIGPLTCSAAKLAIAQDERSLNNGLVDQRLAFYRRIIEENPSQKMFDRGWKARAKSFLK